MAQIEFKRGDTFLIQCQAKTSSGVVDLTGYTVASQARFNGRIVSDFSVTMVDVVNGLYNLSDATTDNWPIGNIEVDIKYVSGAGQIMRTASFQINCQQSVTA